MAGTMLPDVTSFWTDVASLSDKQTYYKVNTINLDAAGGTIQPDPTLNSLYTFIDDVPTSGVITESGITATKEGYTFQNWAIDGSSPTFTATAQYGPIPSPIPTPDPSSDSTSTTPNTGDITFNVLAFLTALTLMISGVIYSKRKRKNNV